MVCVTFFRQFHMRFARILLKHIHMIQITAAICKRWEQKSAFRIARLIFTQTKPKYVNQILSIVILSRSTIIKEKEGVICHVRITTAGGSNDKRIVR